MKCEKHKMYSIPCKICQEIKDYKIDIKHYFDKTKEQEQIIKEILNKESSTEKDAIEALHYFSKNESQIAINLFAAESIIASVWDLSLKIKSDERQSKCKPFINKALEIADKLNVLTNAIAKEMNKKMGSKEYSDLIIQSIKLLDIVSGKIKKCETCFAALDQKKIIKEELDKLKQKE